MPRMETCQPGPCASALQQTRPATDRLLDRSSRLVAAPCLMPASRAYAVPRLHAISTEYQFSGGIDTAARLALTLVSAGLADAAQWARVRCDPFAFIAGALRDFVVTPWRRGTPQGILLPAGPSLRPGPVRV